MPAKKNAHDLHLANFFFSLENIFLAPLKNFFFPAFHFRSCIFPRSGENREPIF